MKLHLLQHATFESPGSILDWVHQRNYPAAITRLDRGEKLPDMDFFDGLIVMGGPMGVSDTGKYPWLTEEKKFLKQCFDAGKKMLGICLGAQLLAEMLGAKVYPQKEKEIGWFPVFKNENTDFSLMKVFSGNSLAAFHWHGDTFDIPKGALPLFSSTATPHQAFVWDSLVFALQFHWEVKPENVLALIKNAPHDFAGGSFVQKPEDMLSGESLFSTIRQQLFLLLDFVFPEYNIP
jgi:GMP synthase-like glutamine amidotransferase